MESILTSIKKLLGIPEDCVDFDTDIIIDINSVFQILGQIGLNPDVNYSISDKTTTWNDYLQGRCDVEMVKTYVYKKVRLMFDPPINTAVMQAVKENIAELEWRIKAAVDFKGGQNG